MNKKETTHIVISPWSIALFTLIPLALYFVWAIRDIMFSLLIAFIVMSSLRPGVQYLIQHKVPRGVAIGLVFAFFVLFFLSLISIIIPPIVIETSNLIRTLPVILEDLAPQLQGVVDFSSISSIVPNITDNVLGFVSALFSNTLFVIATLFFGLYFLIEENLVDKFLHRYISKERADRLSETLAKAEMRMSSWFWGELTLMTVVGVLTYVGLSIIGVKYALPLAVLAGLLEVVPNIGPTISAIPAIIIGFGTSYFTGFSALALAVIIQQLENNLIVPMIMKRAVGLNPILTLLSLLLGGRFGGVLGMLLAIPMVLFIETLVEEYLHPKQFKAEKPAGEKSA
ncbi:AI-2E family transporter [Candidatus Woesebacteria bacterium]|nr:AI-2E family transporter [Candidatus Woesebacteria bacterium]